MIVRPFGCLTSLSRMNGRNVMPLTKKGSKIKSAMKDQYGSKKGEQVFYATENKGKIKGVHKKGKK
jgi:hypothetical protein